MSKFLSILNGKKSYVGFLLLWVAFAFGPAPTNPELAQLHIASVLPSLVVNILASIGAPLGGFGLIHKLAKLEI